MKGAPLRFAAAVVGGWAMGRFAVLWPTTMPIVPPVAPSAVAQQHPAPADRPWASDPQRDRLQIARRPIAGSSHIVTTADRMASLPEVPRLRPPARPTVVVGREVEPQGARERILPVVAPLSSTVTTSRLHIDAWVVARPGGGDDLAFGQLGASQGGARLTYALDRRVALSGRVSAPLRGTGREIGVGVDLKPTRLPIHLLVEQRIDLDGGSMRPALTAIAGGSAVLPWQARVDAYGQAGAVRRRGGFVDAAAIVSRPLVTRGRTRLEIGGGAWGAAQRQVARLDVGPSLALVVPGAGGTLRLQLDYGIM